MTMTKILIAPLMLAAALLLSGCGDAAESGDDHTGHDHGPNESAAEQRGGDEHGNEDGHDDHGDEDGHEGHDDHEGEGAVRLTPKQMEEFDIEVREASAGTVEQSLRLPGEVMHNPNQVAHVTPRVPGVVREVMKQVGDEVQAGDVLATIESAELAESKSDYLARRVERDLAQVDLERAQTISQNTQRVLDKLAEQPDAEALEQFEGLDIGENRRELLGGYAALLATRATANRLERLYDQEITSEAAYLEARSELEQASAEYASARDAITYANQRNLQERQRAVETATFALKAAERKLLALGLDAEQVAAIPEQKDEQLAMAELTAPLAGTVTKRELARGEVVSTETDAFVVADLSNVWVMLTVYPRDLGTVNRGQPVTLRSPGLEPVEAEIDYVSPTVEEETRTASARVVLDNPEGRWRPGLFVTGVIDTGSRKLSNGTAGDDSQRVVIPRSALQEVEGQTAVFVQHADGFEPRFVEVGETGGDTVRIVRGLAPGERYVATNGFTVKAEMGKAEFGDGHDH